MDISLSLDGLLELFFGGGAVLLGLVVGLLLLIGNKGQRRAEVFLGLLIIAYVLMLLNQLLAESGVMSRYQDLYFLPIYYTLSFGPLTYFFVKSKLYPGFRFRPRDWVHFVLPLLQAGFYFSIGFRSIAYKGELWQNFVGPFYQNFEAVVYWISFSAYLWASFTMLRKYRHTKPWQESQLRWMYKLLRYLTILFAITVVYDLANFVLWEFFQINLYNIDWLSFPKNVGMIALAYWLSFNGLVQLRPERVRLLAAPRPSSNVRDTGEDALRLQRMMTEKRVYLNPDLNLYLLADIMDMTPHHLREVIRDNFDKNFNEFINSYRVEEVKRCILDPKNAQFTLLSLGLDSGFNSKSTFNRAFKETEGISPNDFRIKSLKGAK